MFTKNVYNEYVQLKSLQWMFTMNDVYSFVYN